MKEMKTLRQEPPSDVELFPVDEDDLFEWVAFIEGPRDTPYEGGSFQLSISVPPNYPIQPPKVTFQTKVFHPNIHFKV
jgi:peroxin-4